MKSNGQTTKVVSHYLNERETFDFAGLKFQEHLNVFLVVFKFMNTLRTLQIILKIILSAFQIVKELDSFKNHF
ncbi:hypothetical protein BA893_17590 [Vibrio natriegens]|nr:hypothetical protein BA893_17590 [Vibrio natriegens]